MSYCFADYVPLRQGWWPAFPERAGFVLLASPADYPPRWGIFSCDCDLAPSEKVRPVPTELYDRLESASRYPPALGLARDEVAAAFSGETQTQAAFAAYYGERLAEHCRRQAAAPYLLVEALGDRLGYLTRGQFYWVVRYLRGSSSVRWVSADYQVYENPGSDFALSSEQLEDLLLPFGDAG